MTSYKITFYSKTGDKKVTHIQADSVWQANDKFRAGHSGCRVIEVRIADQT